MTLVTYPRLLSGHAAAGSIESRNRPCGSMAA